MENWKLPIYNRRLNDAGYDYDVSSVNSDITLLKIKTDDVEALLKLVQDAADEAAGWLALNKHKTKKE